MCFINWDNIFLCSWINFCFFLIKDITLFSISIISNFWKNLIFKGSSFINCFKSSEKSLNKVMFPFQLLFLKTFWYLSLNLKIILSILLFTSLSESIFLSLIKIANKKYSVKLNSTFLFENFTYLIWSVKVSSANVNNADKKFPTKSVWSPSFVIST